MASTRNETSGTSDAASQAVWGALMDVESWLGLTESMTSLEKGEIAMEAAGIKRCAEEAP
jgi:hypothetical protein